VGRGSAEVVPPAAPAELVLRLVVVLVFEGVSEGLLLAGSTAGRRAAVAEVAAAAASLALVNVAHDCTCKEARRTSVSGGSVDAEHVLEGKGVSAADARCEAPTKRLKTLGESFANEPWKRGWHLRRVKFFYRKEES
jgi:hypothetical protein